MPRANFSMYDTLQLQILHATTHHKSVFVNKAGPRNCAGYSAALYTTLINSAKCLRYVLTATVILRSGLFVSSDTSGGKEKGRLGEINSCHILGHHKTALYNIRLHCIPRLNMSKPSIKTATSSPKV